MLDLEGVCAATLTTGKKRGVVVEGWEGLLLLSGSDSFQRSTLQSKVGVGVRALVAISGVWSHTFSPA